SLSSSAWPRPSSRFPTARAWPAAATKMHARLYRVSGTTLPRLFVTIVFLITVHLWWLWAGLLAVDLGFAALAHLLTPMFVGAITLPLVVLIMGLALHETGHLYTLRLRSRDPATGRLL